MVSCAWQVCVSRSGRAPIGLGAVAALTAGAACASAAAGYLALGALAYRRMSRINPDCGGRFAGFTPGSFDSRGFPVDATPYFVSRYEEVQFPSRDPRVTVRAWWVPAQGDVAASPAVIVVHGHGSCRRDPVVLLAAGMLHRRGFGALLIDLRNHGDSTITDGRHAGGSDEYAEVLGAWDWLQSAQGLEPGQIGAWGASMGAATVLIAAAEEPGLAAVWADSSFASVTIAARDELRRTGYPAVLAPAGLLSARLLTGRDPIARSPLSAARLLGGRPVFITHGSADRRLDVHHALDLAQALARHGASWDLWIVPGAEHVAALFVHPDEYEQRLSGFFSAHLRSRQGTEAGCTPRTTTGSTSRSGPS